MGIEIRLPHITGKSEREQLEQLKKYLYQLREQLQWAFDNIGDVGGSSGYVVTPIRVSSPTATVSTITEVLTLKEGDNANFLEDAGHEGALTNQDSGLAEFIVEEGTNGIWTYRKWNSGIAECWGTSSVTSAFNKTWGALYVCGPTERQNYPFTFVARPVEIVTIRNKEVGCFCYAESENNGMNTTTQTAVYCAARPTSTVEQVTFYIDYHVSGRWK